MKLEDVPLEVLIGELKRRKNLIDQAVDSPGLSERAASDVEVVIKAVCDQWGITKEELLSNELTKAITDPRQASMVIMRCHLSMTFKAIGAVLNKDYSTVIYARQTHDDRMADPIYSTRYTRALTALKRHQLAAAGCLVDIS